jgi:hypothetical protein
MHPGIVIVPNSGRWLRGLSTIGRQAPVVCFAARWSGASQSQDVALACHPIRGGLKTLGESILMDTRVLARWLSLSAVALVMIGCGTPAPTGLPVITTQPTAQTAAVGQTATFTVTATGDAPLSYQWYANGIAVADGASSTYTTPQLTISENGIPFFVYVSNPDGSVESATVDLTVTQTTGAVTLRNDVARTGQNLSESILTPATVSTASFGKIGLLSVDGQVDAQPLFLSNVVLTGGSKRDVLYVATEHASMYAFDAASGAVLWHSSLLGSGETPASASSCGQPGETGITSTPTIDRAHGPNGALYIVTASVDGGGNSVQRLHALDVATGADLFGGPTVIQASSSAAATRSGGAPTRFDPAQYNARAGLLLLNGQLYASWSANCGSSSGSVWIMDFDAATLALNSSLSLQETSGQNRHAADGSGLAADAAGSIYFFDGNAALDVAANASPDRNQGAAGNAFLRFSSSQSLSVLGSSNVFGTLRGSAGDAQTGWGGALVLPDLADASGAIWHLAVGAGKDASIYVVNRDSLGASVYQELDGALSSNGVYGMPAYFNQTVYFGAAGDAIKAFAIRSARLSTSPSSETSTIFAGSGATPSISANGTTNAILWAVENGDAAVLHAYDATNLSRELYNSSQAAKGRDGLGSGNFIAPLVANGKVYVGGNRNVAIFGLLK